MGGRENGRATSRERGYTNKWEQARMAYLRVHPLCVLCMAKGKTHVAQVVDHVVPHRGNMDRFWDSTNWQSLCRSCHNSTKQRDEKSPDRGCDERGIPFAMSHHWHR